MSEQPAAKPPMPAYLHVIVAGSFAVLIGGLGVAIAAELGRPLHVEQRVVEPLGVIDRCEHCHDAASHPGDWLERHPPERFACTPCHGGQGLALTARAAHEASPDWERPLFTPLEQEAACGGCHTSGPLPGAPRLTRGRAAVQARGCAGCHELPGLPSTLHAPPLAGLAAKTTPAWTRGWLAQPAAVLTGARMPRYALTDPERDALVTHLFTAPDTARPTLPEGDAERGRRAVAQRRCATCHRFEERGGTFGVDLTLAGAKLREPWLGAWLLETHALDPASAMPHFRLGPQEAADVAAFAAEQWVPDDGAPPWHAQSDAIDPSRAADGAALFARLGCEGCHAARDGQVTRIGVPLAKVGARRPAELPLPAGAQSFPDVPSWIAARLKAPRTFDAPGGVAGVMPAYETLEGDEAEAIGVAIASIAYGRLNHHAERPGRLPAAHLPGGATGRLLSRFRCLSCHRLDGEGGEVSRVPLDGAGSRLRQAWLQRFLLEPVTIRMDQPERMPVLGLTEPEAALLSAWIGASLQRDDVPELPPLDPSTATEGRAAYERRACGACHVAAGAGTMKGPTLDGACERLQPAWIVAALRAGPSLFVEGRHPDERLPEDEARAIAAWLCTLPAP